MLVKARPSEFSECPLDLQGVQEHMTKWLKVYFRLFYL